MLYTDFPLDDRLQRALATAGFVSPTPIQAAAIPVALDGRDLVGTAQTGTGKTAAFVLPILQKLSTMPAGTRNTRVVILAPTRELVEQISSVFRELGVHTNVHGVTVYGGVAMQPQTRALRNGVEIVVACPGRLLDHIKRRNTDLRQVDCLVLDEADRMLDMGFLPNIQEIIDNLPAERQTMLYSATFPHTLNAFVKKTLKDPVRVEVDTAVPAQTVRHSLYQVKHSLKTALLTDLLQELKPESDSVLIFTRTRVSANQVVEHLATAGMQADVLHSDKTQRARQDTLDRFRSGRFPYLVATDIAARGIDITSISHVINFDMPDNSDDYLHRIGRTGRMERTGHAISLATRGDMRILRDIERMLKKKIEVAYLPGSEPPVVAPPTPRVAQPPQQREAAPSTHRPVQARYQGEGEQRRGPRNAMPTQKPPQRARPAAAQSWSERPRHNARPETSSSAPRADRPGARHGGAAPSTAPTRKERRLQQFGPATGQPRGADRTDRPRVDGEAQAPRASTAFIPAVPSNKRPTGRKFTGMASAAKFKAKNAAGKRQPGEVTSGPRPHRKSAPVHASAAMPGAHKKRPAGRGR